MRAGVALLCCPLWGKWRAAPKGALSLKDCKDTVENFDQPAERAAVNLAAVFAVFAAGHLFAAGIALAVVVGVGS